MKPFDTFGLEQVTVRLAGIIFFALAGFILVISGGWIELIKIDLNVLMMLWNRHQIFELFIHLVQVFITQRRSGQHIIENRPIFISWLILTLRRLLTLAYIVLNFLPQYESFSRSRVLADLALYTLL